MLRVITGVPGSGKTLYAVKSLLEAKERGDFLITNIDGFKFADEFIDSQTQEGITNFILQRDWESFAQSLDGRKIYIVLDEAQRFYSSTGMNRNTQQKMFFFLEYHRHYGANVDLITQSHRSLNSRVYGLLHEIIQVSKVMGITGEQRIRRLDPTTWELIGKDSFKRTQQLFDAYQSSSVDAGHQKPPTAMGRLKLQIGGMILGLLVIFGLMAYTIYGWLYPDQSIPITQQTGQELQQYAYVQNPQQSQPQTNKAPVLQQPIYKQAQMQLSDFVLISQGTLAGYDVTRLEYRTAVFTPEQLKQIGLQYRDLSSGAGLLFNTSTQDTVMVFIKQDAEKAKTSNEKGDNPLSSIPSLDLTAIRNTVTGGNNVSTSPY